MPGISEEGDQVGVGCWQMKPERTGDHVGPSKPLQELAFIHYFRGRGTESFEQGSGIIRFIYLLLNIHKTAVQKIDLRIQE